MVIGNDDARVNVTWKGQNGDLPDAVARDARDADVRAWATEAVRGGGVPGIAADAEAAFEDFVVDRFDANDARPYALIQVRPKVPFGAVERSTGFYWIRVRGSDVRFPGEWGRLEIAEWSLGGWGIGRADIPGEDVRVLSDRLAPPSEDDDLAVPVPARDGCQVKDDGGESCRLIDDDGRVSS